MARDFGRKGLLLSVTLLLVFVAVFDLLSPGSVIRRAWTGLFSDPGTPLERTIDDFRRTRGESIRR